MAYAGASASWQYYLTVDECLVRPPSKGNVRVSGPIASGSLKISAERNQAIFALRGRAGHLPVICRGRLPDNLEENAEVVAEGELRDGQFQAHRVLTRCASKYTSAETDAVRAAKEE